MDRRLLLIPAVVSLLLLGGAAHVHAAEAAAAPKAPPQNVTLKVTDSDVHQVAQMIAQAAGVNIVVADNVKAKVTLDLKDVPWPQALDAVVDLANLNLEKRPDGVLFLSRMPAPGTPVQAQPGNGDKVPAGGPRVTLSYRNRRLGDILAELARDAGISIVVESGRVEKLEQLKVPADRKLDVDLRNVPWGQALAVIVDQAGLELQEKAESLYIVRRPPVTAKFVEADVREVLDIIAKQSGMNVVLAPEVAGKLTMEFSEVPWTDALDVVVTSLGYTWRQQAPNTIMVYGKKTTALDSEIAFFEIKFLRAQELTSLLETIVTDKKAFSFYREEIDAPREGQLEDVVDVLERVLFRNTYRNILIVRDEPFVIRKISALLRKYDTPKLFTMQLDLSQHELDIELDGRKLQYKRKLSEGLKRSFVNRVMAGLRPLLSSRGEVRFEPLIDTVFFHDDAWSLRLLQEYINRNYPRLPFSSQYPVEQYSLLYKDPASIAEVLRNRLNRDAKIEIDPYLNTLSVAAGESDQVYARQLIAVLDIPPENTVVVRVFQLKYALAEDVAKRINELVEHASDLLKKQREEAQRRQEAAAKTGPAKGGGIRAIGVETSTYRATQEQTRVLEESLEPADQPEALATGQEPLAGVRISAGAITGNAIADKASNCVIVTTRSETLGVIQSLIAKLDIPPMQVVILAQVLETTIDRVKDVGVDWNLEASVGGSVVPTTFPFPRTSPDLRRMVGSIDPSARGPGNDWPESSNRVFPYAEADDFTTGTISFAKLAITLKMLRDDDDTRLISSPMVSTLSNHPAQFLVETSFEYRKRTDVAFGDGGQIGVSYETAIAKDLIKLDVTPQVTPDGNVIMDLVPEVSNVVRFDVLQNADGTEDKLPITTKRKTVTRVMVPSGRTLVLSGLIQNRDAISVSGVPGLSKIPGLGKAFSKEKKEKSERNLVFFITPIIKKAGDDYLRRLTQARLAFWGPKQDPWTVIQDGTH